MRGFLASLLLLASFVPAAVAQPLLDWSADEVRAVARHGPWPPPPVRDPSNRVSGTPAGIALGEHLFNDPRLSGSGKMSCATCHQAGRDWSDGRAKGFGTVDLHRRTPSLWNIGYSHWFGWDGAGDSLWAQTHPSDRGSVGNGRQRARIAGLLRDDMDLACGYQRAFGAAVRRRRRTTAGRCGQGIGGLPGDPGQPRTRFDDFRDALVAGDRAARGALSACPSSAA